MMSFDNHLRADSSVLCAEGKRKRMKAKGLRVAPKKPTLKASS